MFREVWSWLVERLLASISSRLAFLFKVFTRVSAFRNEARFVLVVRRVKGNSFMWNGILLPKEICVVLEHFPLVSCMAFRLDTKEIQQLDVKKVVTKLKGHENDRGLLVVSRRFPLFVNPAATYDVYYFIFPRRVGRKVKSELWIGVDEVRDID